MVLTGDTLFVGDAEDEPSDPDLVAVLHGSMGEGALAFSPITIVASVRSASSRKTAHKVGVKVGFDHPPDREPESRRLVEVLLDVTPGIDHRRLSLGADPVGALGETTQVELLEVLESPGFRLPRERAFHSAVDTL